MSKQVKIVAYLRVSTKKQGQSGLGLEGQRVAVESYAAQVGGKIVAEYVEIETGTNKRNRPQMSEALSHCRLVGATLVVAKLDRLSRNVAFLSTLMEAGVEFVCCDMPHATKLTIHILAAVAEAEAEAISQRTKAALAAAKARGVKLGSSRPGHWDGREYRRMAGLEKGRRVSLQVRREQSRDRLAFLFPRLQEWREQGLSFAKVAEKLNEKGYTTARGKSWTAMAAKRACDLAIA